MRTNRRPRAKMQTGIWYAPDIHWAGFDILVRRRDDDDGELLAFADVEQRTRGGGAPRGALSCRGKRDHLNRVAVSAPTTVPSWFGLPPIAPRASCSSPTARLWQVRGRSLKRKLTNLDEARFDEGPGWHAGFFVGGRAHQNGARQLVNPRRVASVRARRSAPIRRRIVEAIVLDVEHQDLQETVFGPAWRALGAEGEARVMAGCPGCSWPLVDDQDERVRRASLDAWVSDAPLARR